MICLKSDQISVHIYYGEFPPMTIARIRWFRKRKRAQGALLQYFLSLSDWPTYGRKISANDRAGQQQHAIFQSKLYVILSKYTEC